MLYAIVGLLVVIVDQWVKYWVSGTINGVSTGEPFIPGVISLVNLHNDGAAFSFLAGSNARIPFIIITGVFIVLVILALATRFISGRFARWCLVLVTAGGLGNCIDRVIYGYVQDMFKCELFNFPIFNVADVFITVFAILFVFAVLFERKTVYDDLDDAYLDDEEEDEDEEDEPRLSRKERKAQRQQARRAARSAQAVMEEDEENEALPAQRPARKTRKERAEEAYLQAQAEAEAARRKAEAAAAARHKAEAEAAARRKAEAEAAARRQAEAEAAPRRRVEPARRPQQNVEDPFAAWEAANAKLGTQQPGRPARPAAEAVRAPRHAAPSKPAAKPKAADEEFSLDDILAEFK